MSVSYPTTSIFEPSRVELWVEPNIRLMRSPINKTSQIVEFPGSIWNMIITLPNHTQAAGAEREAFFNSLRMGVVTCAIHHLMRPVPRGTARGSPRLSAAVSKGATVLPIENLAVGATYLSGDMIKVGGQLFQVTAPVTASAQGEANVPVIPPARVELDDEDAVTWDKVTAEFIPTEHVRARYRPGQTEELSVQFMEIF